MDKAVDMNVEDIITWLMHLMAIDSILSYHRTTSFLLDWANKLHTAFENAELRYPL